MRGQGLCGLRIILIIYKRVKSEARLAVRFCILLLYGGTIAVQTVHNNRRGFRRSLDFDSAPPLHAELVDGFAYLNIYYILQNGMRTIDDQAP